MADPIEGRTQSILNSLEAGRANLVIRIFLSLVVAAAILAIFAHTQFRGLADETAMHYAQVGRNLAEGNGFTTRAPAPAIISILNLRKRHSDPEAFYPETELAPLFPFLESVGFRIFGLHHSDAKIAGRYAPEIGWIVPLNILACLGTCALIYGLGRRLFARRVGFLAAVLYLVGLATLRDTISGHPYSVAAFFVTAAFYSAHVAVVRWRERPAVTHWIRPMACAGLSFGLSVLTLYSLLFLAIPLVVLLCHGIDQRRALPLAAFVLVAAVVILPWTVRNQVTSGSPFGLAPYAVIADSALFPDDTFDRSLSPVIDRVRARRAVTMKFWENLTHLASDKVWKLGGGLVMAFFMVSFLYQFVREEADQLRWAVAFALAILILIAAFLPGSGRQLLHVLVPMIALFGTAYFFQILEQYELEIPVVSTTLIAILIGLTALPAGLTILTRRPGIPYPPYYPPLVRHVSNLLNPDEWLCADIPQAVAWYGNRTSVKLPLRLDDFYRIHDRIHSLHGLYLTSVTGDRAYDADLVRGSEKDWLPILNRQVPVDFPLAQGVALPPGTTEQLFLTDRVRW